MRSESSSNSLPQKKKKTGGMKKFSNVKDKKKESSPLLPPLSRLGLFALHLLDVELQLLALEDVPVGAAALPRAAGDARVEPPRRELVLEGLVQDARLAAGLELARDVVAPLGGLLGGLGGGGLLLGGARGGVLLLRADLDTVVLGVPLFEGGRVDLHDGRLDQSLRPHELVVGRVVDDVEDARLARDGLGAPREVAVVETQRTELEVTASDAHAADGDGGGELGVGGLAAELVPGLFVFVVDRWWSKEARQGNGGSEPDERRRRGGS